MKDPVSYELSVFPLEFLSTLHAELAVLVRCSLVRLLAIHSHGQCGQGTCTAFQPRRVKGKRMHRFTCSCRCVAGCVAFSRHKCLSASKFGSVSFATDKG